MPARPLPLQNEVRPADRQGVERAHVLGVDVDCLVLPQLLGRVRDAAENRRSTTVMYVNAHCMNVQYRDPAHRAILAEADIVYCDGVGIQLAARVTGQPIPPRMTGADWIEDLCLMATERGLSIYLLGAASGVAQEAAAALHVRYPGLHIAGAGDGYSEDRDAIVAINDARPDILLVGMGTPRQEKWIAHHRASLDVPVVWAVGGLFDFASGRVRRGPRWMTQNGLEWLCRLILEPRRLWRRYLLGNPRFLLRVVLNHALPGSRHASPEPRSGLHP